MHISHWAIFCHAEKPRFALRQFIVSVWLRNANCFTLRCSFYLICKNEQAPIFALFPLSPSPLFTNKCSCFLFCVCRPMGLIIEPVKGMSRCLGSVCPWLLSSCLNWFVFYISIGITRIDSNLTTETTRSHSRDLRTHFAFSLIQLDNA